MLVGTSPFKGTNEADLLKNIRTKELVVPKDVTLSRSSVEILIKVVITLLFQYFLIRFILLYYSYLNDILYVARH